ncbi:TetR/AcrR family transcriptional regulator [Nocardioides montaniterrae]
MAKATVSKLVPKVPKTSVSKATGAVTGATRRAAYSASTRRALIDISEELFTENGYAATSLEAIVSGARVTKGALYHHFSGKQALFEAVFERVEADASKQIQKALRGSKDPWKKASNGLRAFLEVVREPRYRRIVIQEGPAVLGHERYREQEERSTFANVVDIVRTTLHAGRWDLDDDMLQTFSRIFFGAMSSAGEQVATADDSEGAAQRVQTAIGFLLTGVQMMVEAGVDLPLGVAHTGELPVVDDDEEPAEA